MHFFLYSGQILKQFDFDMKTITDMNDMPQWATAKRICEAFGITTPQLRRYAAEGLVKTSNICRPGQTRGIRLFNVLDLDRLIHDSIEQPTEGVSDKGCAAAAGNPNGTSN